MRGPTRTAVAVLLGVLAGAVLSSAAAADAVATTLITQHSDRTCAGESAILDWSAPAGVPDLTGYRVDLSTVTPGAINNKMTYVTAEQTDLSFTVPFGFNIFYIYPITSSSGVGALIGSISFTGSRAPTAMGYTLDSADVGDQSATVPYKWWGGITTSTTGGGSLPNTIRFTASPGGDSIEIPATAPGVVANFIGLTNGVAYRFSAVTFNDCGSSEAVVSPAFTPGIRPTWTASTPPLTVAKGKSYQYEFDGSGSPSVSYRLVGAPSWLMLGTGGAVSGVPPKDERTFTYSVEAGNGVGIVPGVWTNIVAGPFTVAVTRGQGRH